MPMEPSPFSNSSTSIKSQDGHQEPRILTLERLLSRVSQGRGLSVKAHELHALNQIDLDGENLNKISEDVLNFISSATRLFLQNNSLTELTVLSGLINLRYLNLAHNKLCKINGISGMTRLVGLNLMHNQIANVDASDLPTSLQFIQMKGNPVANNARVLFTHLAESMPNLRQIDGVDVSDGHKVQDMFFNASSDESDGSANALVEAAIKDVAEEDLVRARSAMKALNIPQALLRHVSGETLDRLGSTASKEGQSPIRVTPAASRQTSQDLADLCGPSGDAKDFVSRVREALPTVREFSDVNFNKRAPGDFSRHTEASGFGPRRSISLENSGSSNSRRQHSESHASFRTLTLPSGVERKFSGRSSPGVGKENSPSHSAPIFPLIHAPPNYKSYPKEFQNTLSSAISMLVGSTGPPRKSFQDNTEPQTIWAQSQSHRQKVLDYLFAKRTPEPTAEPTKDFDKASTVPPARRSSFDRMDSTISNHDKSFHGRKGGSAISDEMLQGLQKRDPPRAKGLSAAIQGPPTDPPGVQLASLSENHDETAAAERVRIHLRRGLVKMLDNAQKRRELEPAQETSVLVELQKLKETKTLRNLLGVRQGHMPPQPQVLSTILESHARLGSITDRLEKVLPRTSSYGVEIDAAPLGSYKSVTQIGTQTGITSPFAGPKSSADSAASDNSDQPMLKSLGSRQSFIRSATTGAIPGKGLYPEIREAPKEGSPFSSKPPQLNTSKANRAQSSRRQIPEPGSPGSDQDPDPPRTRQDARPIFGGIAKQFRGQTAQSDASRPQNQGSKGGVDRPNLPNPPNVPKFAQSAQRPPTSSPFGPTSSGASSQNPSPQPHRTSAKDKAAMLRQAPGTQSQKSMSMSRSQSSYLGVLQTSDDLKLIQVAAQEAEKRQNEFQNELWERMSGIPSQHKGPTDLPRTHDGVQTSSMVPSPFSSFSSKISGLSQGPDLDPQKSPSKNSLTPEASPVVAPSPFSQATQNPRPSYDSSFIKAPARVPATANPSPFAHTNLPQISKPERPRGVSSDFISSSTPVLATQNLLTEHNEGIPDAMSAPPNNTINEAIKGAIKAHQRRSGSKSLGSRSRSSSIEQGNLQSDSEQHLGHSSVEGTNKPDTQVTTKPPAETFKSPFSL